MDKQTQTRIRVAEDRLADFIRSGDAAGEAAERDHIARLTADRIAFRSAGATRREG